MVYYAGELMPKYRIGSPDGKTWEVNAPDGATQEEVLAYAQSQWKAPRPQLSGAEAIPKGPGDMAGPAAPAEQTGIKLPYGLNNLVGAGETALSIGSAIPASVYGMMAGAGELARSGKYGTPEGANLLENAAVKSMSANAYRPRTAAGLSQLESLAPIMQNLMPVAGLGGEMAALGRGARPAMAAAGDATGAALGKAGDVVVRGRVDPQVAALAQVAEKYDIPIAPHMLGTNKFARMFGNAAEQDVPLAFSKVKGRQAAFNKAVLTQIDSENTATRATPDVVVAAMNKSGEGIGDIAAKTTLVVTPEVRQAITGVVSSSKDYGADVYRLVSARARDLNALVSNGELDGTAFKKWNSKVLEDIRNSDGTTQATLGKLQEVAMDAFESSIAKEDLPKWTQYRKEYAIGKQLFPVFAKSPVGDISPASLMQRVTAGKDATNRMATGRGGDLGELAKIGQQFLKEPGTFSIPERAAGYGLLGTGAVLGGSPAIAAGAGWGASALYNLLGPSVVRSLTKQKETLSPRPRELTTSRGFQEMPRSSPDLPLGDLTPEWQTSPGAGGGGLGGLAADMHMPLAIKKTGVPYQPTVGPRPQYPNQLSIPTDQLGLLGDVGTSRLKGRPQMPAQPGFPGVSDTAIAGYAERTGKKAPKPFVDIAEGSPPGKMVGKGEDATFITRKWSPTVETAMRRLLAKPRNGAGDDLAARITSILNEPNKTKSLPDQIMTILNEYKGNSLAEQISAILRGS